MRRLGLSVVVGLVALALVGLVACGRDPLVVAFHREGCPDCAFMRTVLDSLVADHPDLTIVYHEMSELGASELLLRLSQAYGVAAASVPVIFVGDKPPIVGAGRAQELALREAVEACLSADCPSPMTRAGGSLIPWADFLVAGGFVVLFLLFLLIQGS